ncbi:hypothetical protein CSC70_04655 [Pseudoxanthomonas kalamensis DSM 18571]|uniref:DUF418 domain-containing protein n=1 Tax=Pseudoxanthomonas kalamensis TaxID=289483 RepID=UPI001390B3B0|nr:DUF418 domain-containing protein [Pseudoxanthomonas kalamensis]KAF1711212.1 hypothetical protein CSC70_04655 [Pseudoxanthomonas kalamensis DSM 18571]
MPVDAALAPVAPGERLQSLDVVRGFALLGILLMNMEGFVGPTWSAGGGIDPALGGLDRWADGLIYLLVQGKFYTLFSLLFGMGFAVMSQRAETAGRDFAGVYWRRGLVLLGIGLLHAVLVWSGDILVAYALLSFFLLAFRPLRGGWLVVLALLAYAAPSALMLMIGAVGSLMQLDPQAASGWNEMMSEQQKMMASLIEAQRQAFGNGSWLEAVRQRLQDLGLALTNLTMVGPQVFGMFLLGAWFVHSGAIVQPQRFPRLYAALRWIALPAGLAAMGLSIALQPDMSVLRFDLRSGFAYSLAMLAGLLLCLAYLAWLLRGLQSPRGRRLLAWLAPAGRMALSNYLLQSLVCTWVFYGYGLGYFEQLPRAWQVPFALALFCAQVLLSRAWLARFRFGPAEWVWRSLTYLKPQPMRQTVAA